MTDAASVCYRPEQLPSAPRLRSSRVREGAPVRTILPRPFHHVDELSYGEPGARNLLIQGENLRVLQALPESYLGAVRCIYIDPPYNNREQYRHYGDVWGHEEWLAMMVERLRAMKPLLARDGSIWISIDDGEVHYLKVAADGVFGRDNFVTTIVWQQRTTRENRRVFSNNHEYILVYAADAPAFHRARNLLPASPEIVGRYKNPDSDPRGPWQSISANVQDGHATATQFYEIEAPNGRLHRPPEGRCWIYTSEKMQAEIAAGNIWFGASGNGVPRLKRFLRSSDVGMTPDTLWRADEVGTNDEAKKHLLQLLPEQAVFDTPKPERLVSRILAIASNEGDLVLDAFLGSGTTSAVAHKLGRRYVGIEQGDHAATHCAARLRMVVDGEGGGISVGAGWSGGGGFDYYRMR